MQRGPEVIELIDKLMGEWDVVSTRAPTSPQDSTKRNAVEIWKPGPAHLSIIEEYFEDGRLAGHATIWSSTSGEFSVLWCDDAGCRVLNRPARWREGLFVIEDEVMNGQGRLALRETFDFKSRTRFVQTLFSGPSFDRLVLSETMEATRRG